MLPLFLSLLVNSSAVCLKHTWYLVRRLPPLPRRASCWHCRDARSYGHINTVMHKMSTPPQTHRITAMHDMTPPFPPPAPPRAAFPLPDGRL